MTRRATSLLLVLGIACVACTGRPDLTPPDIATVASTHPVSPDQLPAGTDWPSLCDRQTMSGDFDGDGSFDSVVLGTSRLPGGGCPSPDKGDRLLTIDLGGNGTTDVRSTALDCTTLCTPFAVVNFGGDAREEILIQEGHLAPPASAVIGVYELRGRHLEPVLFPDGANQFWLQDSWQGYLGAYCSDAWTLTTWKGRTNESGSITTISSRTFAFDVGSHSFRLASAQPPRPASRRLFGPDWQFERLCGAHITIG